MRLPGLQSIRILFCWPITAYVIVAAGLLCGACNTNIRHPEIASVTVGAGSENREANGMKLMLTFSQQVQLTATVKNGTDGPVRLLMNSNIMPCRLSLLDEQGREIVPRDRREKMKYPPDPEPHEYVTIEPGTRVTVQSSRFTASATGGIDLKWGPFLYYGLSPGQYTASAKLVSDGTAASAAPGAYSGTLASESIKFTLDVPNLQ